MVGYPDDGQGQRVIRDIVLGHSDHDGEVVRRVQVLQCFRWNVLSGPEDGVICDFGASRRVVAVRDDHWVTEELLVGELAQFQCGFAVEVQGNLPVGLAGKIWPAFDVEITDVLANIEYVFVRGQV